MSEGCSDTGVSPAEEWRPVPGFPGVEASSGGEIAVEGVVKHQWIGTAGYPRVKLRGHSAALHPHRLVALAFYGEPEPGQCVRHLDGVPANNDVRNIRWGTASENARDRARHGRDAHARKTHCPAGHPYDDANTYVVRRGGRNVGRRCRACTCAQNTASRQRRRLRAAGITEQRAA